VFPAPPAYLDVLLGPPAPPPPDPPDNPDVPGGAPKPAPPPPPVDVIEPIIEFEPDVPGCLIGEAGLGVADPPAPTVTG